MTSNAPIVNLTPLGRNEFICWVEDAKQAATRQRRIARTCEELLEGKKRPCCWPGCIHRTDKAPSRSQKAMLIDKEEEAAVVDGRLRCCKVNLLREYAHR